MARLRTERTLSAKRRDSTGYLRPSLGSFKFALLLMISTYDRDHDLAKQG